MRCGFCTPGLIVQAHDMLRATVGAGGPVPIFRGAGGNLYRCTGYEKILDTVRLAGKQLGDVSRREGEGER